METNKKKQTKKTSIKKTPKVPKAPKAPKVPKAPKAPKVPKVQKKPNVQKVVVQEKPGIIEEGISEENYSKKLGKLITTIKNRSLFELDNKIRLGWK